MVPPLQHAREDGRRVVRRRCPTLTVSQRAALVQVVGRRIDAWAPSWRAPSSAAAALDGQRWLSALKTEGFDRAAVGEMGRDITVTARACSLGSARHIATALDSLDAAARRHLVTQFVPTACASPRDERGHTCCESDAMQNSAVLTNAAERASHDGARRVRTHWSDVLEGAVGVATIAAAFLTPFLREQRSHWGVAEAFARRKLPGDDLVPLPRWLWTHGIEIDAPADEVWPWVAQIGGDRGGFYSYQFLENVAGARARDADAIHPEWEVQPGQTLRVVSRMPPMQIVEVIPKRGFVAFAPADIAAKMSGKSWIATSWLFYIAALGPRRSRFVSRYRCACSDEVLTTLQFGPMVLEPIGFAMDRRMLMGVKQRAERTS